MRCLGKPAKCRKNAEIDTIRPDSCVISAGGSVLLIQGHREGRVGSKCRNAGYHLQFIAFLRGIGTGSSPHAIQCGSE